MSSRSSGSDSPGSLQSCLGLRIGEALLLGRKREPTTLCSLLAAPRGRTCRGPPWQHLGARAAPCNKASGCRQGVGGRPGALQGGNATAGRCRWWRRRCHWRCAQPAAATARYGHHNGPPSSQVQMLHLCLHTRPQRGTEPAPDHARSPLPPPPTSPLSRRRRAERGESLVQHLESDDYSAISAILLPHGYHFREGSELWDGVKLGRLLGSGMQVGSGAGGHCPGRQGREAAAARERPPRLAAATLCMHNTC